MKIAFVIPTMRMGGAEKSLCNLLNRMVAGKDEIDLILFSKEGELLKDIPESVKIYSLSDAERAMVLEWRFFCKALFQPLDIEKLLRRFLVLVIDHVQRLFHIGVIDSWRIISPSLSSFPNTYDLAIGYLEGTADFYTLDKVKAQKKIGWIHIDFNKRRKNLRYDKKYYERFDRIATISETCKQAFIERFPEMADNIEIVPNISDRYYIEQQSKVFTVFDQDEYYHIVTIGRLEEQKGIDIAVEVAAVLTQREFPFIWHVYGEGTKKNQLLQRIAEHSLEKCFLLEGIVENPYPYIRCSDVIVQPSRYEGKSIVLDESKILCKPIIVTNYTTVKDQIVDKKTGVICDFEPSQIADAIINVCTNQKFVETLSNECKREKEICDDDYLVFTDLVKRVMV